MPTEPSQSPEQVLKEAMFTMLISFLRMYAIQAVLEKNGLLTKIQVDQRIDEYKKIPQIAAVLSSFGTPSLDIEQLLRNFEGTVQ